MVEVNGTENLFTRDSKKEKSRKFFVAFQYE